MFAAGECPDAIVVFVDAWTSYGGSQFLNSSGTGRYQDYLCDEVVSFVDDRYPTAADRDHRGITGKSSGGYGAMVVPMMRPDVFGALASHAGDALFECLYVPGFAETARTLRDEFEGSYEAFFERLAEADRFDMGRFGTPLMNYGCAACFSPDPDRPGKPLLPFEVSTGRLVDEVWERWLELDPVRMAPRHADALRSLRRIYLDAGRGDEWYLDLGAQAFAGELEKLGADHTLELFDGKHGGLGYRYPAAIRELVLALSASAPRLDADSLRQPGDRAGQRAGPAALLLDSLAAQHRGADDHAAGVAKRLRRHSHPRRLDDRQPGDLVAAVQRQRGEDAPGNPRGRNPVPGVAEGVVNAVTVEAADHGQVGRGDVDRAAPGVLDSASPERREETDELALHLGDHAAVQLDAAVQAGARRQPAASPAEDDAPVGGGAEVVDQVSRVGDALAARPAELGEHVGHRLGDHHVAGGDGEPPAQGAVAGERTGRWRGRPGGRARSRDRCRASTPWPLAASRRTGEPSKIVTPRCWRRARSPSANRAGCTVAATG